MSPSSHPILPLLYCPSCPPRTFLSNPITQKSGITLCSHHAAESSTSSPALPFDAPKAPIASAAVAFYPAQSTETTLPPIDVKVDVTVNKILNLVQRWLLESDPDTTTSQQSSDDSLQRLQDSLVSELTCEICFSLLHQPVTTPCQHTFCSSCLQRSIDHSTICPLCRQDLPGYAYFQLHPHNRLISNILKQIFPELYRARVSEAKAELDGRLDTPIFVCQLSMPGVPTLLQIFEPRYRLMLRRCLESPEPRFGMIMPPGNTTEYGTMLEIRSVQMLPDGRSMVETWGASRFRIIERGNRDGYMVARVEFFEDYTPEEELALYPNLSPTNEELIAVCHDFIRDFRRGAVPWVLQRMHSTAAFMPQDPANFSFWMALILPLHEREKAKLLSIRSSRVRLQIVVHWIGKFRDSWYARWDFWFGWIIALLMGIALGFLLL
jgi:Lon protease-like protein